jgi:cation diffusion facilitator family transporter
VSTATDTTRGQRLALTGLLVNVVLSMIKLLAGLVGHSYALVADAIESMTDIVGSVVIWGGLRIASKPADEDHPYGHGKAESLAALIVAMMIIAAGLGIAAKSISEILTPHHTPAAFTLWVLIAVVIIKGALFWFVRRASKETGSGAVAVDAWHHVSDAVTSLAAFVGITISLIWAYPAADDIAALLASAIIIFNGVLLFRGPVHELMDREPPEVVAQARAVAESIPGVVNTEKIAAHTHGTRYWVDMHVRVDPLMSVRDAHALSHKVKDAVRERLPRVADVLIHIEPAPDQGGAGE